MLIAITILCVSFLAMTIVLWNKNSQMTTGRSFVQISTPERDARMEKWFGRMMYQVTHVSYASIKNSLHNILVASEMLVLKIFVKLGKRFHTIGDIVRGKNIPKNRGAVSFFLKNIE